jgi:hypothetical protein
MLEIIILYEDYLTVMNDCVYNIIGQMLRFCQNFYDFSIFLTRPVKIYKCSKKKKLYNSDMKRLLAESLS